MISISSTSHTVGIELQRQSRPIYSYIYIYVYIIYIYPIRIIWYLIIILHVATRNKVILYEFLYSLKYPYCLSPIGPCDIYAWHPGFLFITEWQDCQKAFYLVIVFRLKIIKSSFSKMDFMQHEFSFVLTALIAHVHKTYIVASWFSRFILSIEETSELIRFPSTYWLQIHLIVPM